jgi:hypothetical protein
LELVGRGAVADDPVDLESVGAEDQGRRGGLDAVLLEDGAALLRVGIGPEEDEILVLEGVELGVFVELLAEQLAAPSATAVEVDNHQLVLELGLGYGLVQAALEPALSGGEGGENEHESRRQRFSHVHLFGESYFRPLPAVKAGRLAFPRLFDDE